jgi:hypothetical protein
LEVALLELSGISARLRRARCAVPWGIFGLEGGLAMELLRLGFSDELLNAKALVHGVLAVA